MCPEYTFNSVHVLFFFINVSYPSNFQNRNLRVLDLQECDVEDLSGHWLSHFPDSFTSLETLNMACLGSEVSFSALERLVARSPNLKTLRLNRTVPLEKLSMLLQRAPQLVEFGTGSYSADIRSDVYSSLADAFSACKNLQGLSGFWDVVPAYLPAFYSVCSQLTSLNLSYATTQSPDLTKIVSQCHKLQRLLVCLKYFSVLRITWGVSDYCVLSCK